MEDPLLASRACNLALDLGTHLRDDVRTNLENEACWSLSGKASSAALAFEWLDLCFPSQGWALLARKCLNNAVVAFESQVFPLSAGLFGGLTGLAFATKLLSRGGTRYRNLHAQLHEIALQGGQEYLKAVSGRPQLAASDYDLISGITGIGTYALTTLESPGSLSLLESCLEFIASPGAVDISSRFFIDFEQVESPTMRAHYPRGYIDCGMAHGVSGPIALLALSLTHGVRPRNVRAALETLARWLATRGTPTHFGVNWPAAVDNSRSSEPARTAWCYGNPGVARALWLAGRALEQDDLCDSALAAFMTVSRMPLAQRGIDSPTFCHGLAGLTHIAIRFAYDTGDAGVINFAAGLVEELLTFYESRRDGSSDIPPRGWLVENDGLLEGPAGVVLSLLAAGSSSPPDWDRLCLLS